MTQLLVTGAEDLGLEREHFINIESPPANEPRGAAAAPPGPRLPGTPSRPSRPLGIRPWSSPPHPQVPPASHRRPLLLTPPRGVPPSLPRLTPRRSPQPPQPGRSPAASGEAGIRPSRTYLEEPITDMNVLMPAGKGQQRLLRRLALPKQREGRSRGASEPGTEDGVVSEKSWVHEESN